MVRQMIWQKVCKRKDTFKAENAQPEDQCDKKFPKKLHESTSSQTPSSVGNQGEDQVDFVSPRSRREIRRQNKQMITNLYLKKPEQKNKDIGIQTEHSFFLENTDNLKAELKKTKADLCKRKVKVSILTKKLERLEAKEKKHSKIVRTLHDQCTPAQAKRILTLNQKIGALFKRRYVPDLIIRSMSRRDYEYLRQKKIMQMPSIRTQERWLQYFKMNPGFQDDSIKVFQEMIKTNTFQYNKEARAKENAVEIIHNWFDEVNSRQIYDKIKLRCALGINFEDQLDKMELFLDTFKVIGRGNKIILPWQRGMRVSIKSTRAWYHDLISNESCSEFEFTLDIHHEVHVDSAINHQLDQFKKWDLNFQGLSYVMGVIAHKMKLLYPDLGKRQSGIYLNDHGLTPWIYHLSRGGLMVPSDYFLRDYKVFDQKFKEFHIPLLDRHPKVIERFCQVLEESFGGKYDKAVLNLFANTRKMIRIRYLNAQLKFNTGGNEKIRGKKSKLANFKFNNNLTKYTI
ncbi:unnamed protein product [Lepeophtheirus salmonis]|uniref:(salmon louse) hypothetical protein n=1 Tax=Lepeophtheirus salmonis TaxID=72036 RepID=A0A7R8CER3_LEPSM|nr:unnamed protein product [Lepeophtheirus salmonis]CAF2797941.1 unnamed protein product [Lepeophtheirus salmonis]